MKNFNEQTTVRQLSETLDISAVFSRMFTFDLMVWRMGKSLNGRSEEDLTLSDVLAGRAFDYVHCQHTGEFDQKKIFKSLENAWGLMGSFGIDWNIT